MADIRKFPSKHLDKLRLGYRDFVKKGASLKDWQKLTKDLSPDDMDFMHDLRDVDFPNLRGNPMNRPETSGKGYGPTGISYPKGMNTEIKPNPKIDLRKSVAKPEVTKPITTPKVSKRGFKWGIAAKVAGKALGGVGVVADVLTPPINFDTGKVHRHPVYDRMSRNINKVTLGIK